jgi:hypothetical protein
VELDAESEVADYPFWKLPKDEQTSAKVYIPALFPLGFTLLPFCLITLFAKP